jgi:hypothetical protein
MIMIDAPPIGLFFSGSVVTFEDESNSKRLTRQNHLL